MKNNLLQSGGVSVEEFHGSLQEVTHFPLRPFVLPFLRSHLPFLQRELQTLARRAAMVSYGKIGKGNYIRFK